MSLQTFTAAYIEAMLFSSNDESDDQGGEPLDKNYSADDIAHESMQRIEADCATFYAAHSHLFNDDHCSYVGCPADEYAGHDFWLTRNGHGCGFWDGDWSAEADAILTRASRAFGSRDPYVGDDGKVHL